MLAHLQGTMHFSPSQLEIERKVLQFVVSYVAQHGSAPTHREIAAACYIAKSIVAAYLNKLEAEGFLRRQPGKPRAIELTPRAVGSLADEHAALKATLRELLAAIPGLTSASLETKWRAQQVVERAAQIVEVLQ